MGSADYSLPVLSGLTFAIPTTGFALFNAVSTGNTGLEIILGIIMAGEFFVIGRQFGYHRFLKYAAYQTYINYHYDDFGDRDLDTYASNGTFSRLRSPETLANLKQYENDEFYGLGYHWWRVPYFNGGGGEFILGSDLPPPALSPPIIGVAPLDGFGARTNLHDITTDKLSTIRDVQLELPETKTNRLVALLSLRRPESGPRMVQRDVPIFRHAYSDWEHLRSMAKRVGIEPKFKSRQEAIEMLQGVGKEYLTVTAQPHKLREKTLQVALDAAMDEFDFQTKMKEETGPDVVWERGAEEKPPEKKEEEKGRNWALVIAAVVAIALVSFAALLAGPQILAYASSALGQQQGQKLPEGYHYVVFYAGGIPNSARWNVTFAEHIGTHTNTANNYIAFGIANGQYAFTVSPPAGYVAQPPAGHITVNGSDISQNILFVKSTATTTTTTAKAP